jgi:hypothetical protein
VETLYLSTTRGYGSSSGHTSPRMSVLEGAERSASRPDRFYTRNIVYSLGGPQSHCGCGGENRKLLPLPESNHGRPPQDSSLQSWLLDDWSYCDDR